MNNKKILDFIHFYQGIDDELFYDVFKGMSEVEEYKRTAIYILREHNMYSRHLYNYLDNEERKENINRAINILKEIIHRIEYIRNEKNLKKQKNACLPSKANIRAIEDVLYNMRKSYYHSVGKSAMTMEFRPYNMSDRIIK